MHLPSFSYAKAKMHFHLGAWPWGAGGEGGEAAGGVGEVQGGGGQVGG